MVSLLTNAIHVYLRYPDFLEETKYIEGFFLLERLFFFGSCTYSPWQVEIDKSLNPHHPTPHTHTRTAYRDGIDFHFLFQGLEVLSLFVFVF